MRKKYIFGKKLYISVLTSILVLLTTIATTFAWVGVFANSTFDKFDISIYNSELSEYSIEISATGKEGTFSDTIPLVDIQKQILLNWGYGEASLSSEEEINKLFLLLNQDQCTTVPNVLGDKIVSLGDFTDIYGQITHKYFKFDIYVSVKKSYQIDESGFLLDVYLDKGLLDGRIGHKTLVNSYTYPSDFINPYDELINQGNLTLPEGFTTIKANQNISYTDVNSQDAARVAFEKYKVVDKYDTSAYLNESPLSTIIYQDSYESPIYNPDTKVYSFGAILEDPYNLSTAYYNSTEYQYINHHYWNKKVPMEILQTRGFNGTHSDLRLSSKTNHLIDSSKADEQIGINQMMKMTVYFWFEGWDADCFNAINASPVNINIGLNMVNQEDF